MIQMATLTNFGTTNMATLKTSAQDTDSDQEPSRRASTQVTQLDLKLKRVSTKLRLSTLKEVAERLGGIHPSNLSQWIKDEGYVPNHHLQGLADMIRMSTARFAASSAAEFDRETEHFQPDASPWLSVIQRARMMLIALRPVLPSVVPALAVRGVVKASQWEEYAAAEEERFRVGDRICVDLSVPWEYFRNTQRVLTLLLETDERGTALVTPAGRPLSVERRQITVTVPPAGPLDPFVITQPSGMQAFTALFFEQPLDATLAAELDGSATRRPGAVPYLEATALNALATHLLHREPWQWTVAHKQFLVEAS